MLYKCNSRMIFLGIFFILINAIFSQCDDGYVELNNQCYYQTDLNVLQQFINNSQSGINPPPYDMSPLSLGVQGWSNGRLVEFKCSTIYPTYLDYELSGDVPSSISSLDELTKLYINANELTNLPDNLGDLVNLNVLELGGNNFETIPSSIGELSNLEWFYIYNNQITYIPESICNISENLSNLSIEYNLLCNGTYPECIEDNLSIQDTSDCFEICEEFNIDDIQIIQNTEWGNFLYVYLNVPEVSLYAPSLFLQTDDEYISFTDLENNFFYITGPSVIDLHFTYNHNFIPENHILYANINLITEDEVLNCNLPFNVTFPGSILGDVNFDGTIDILDVVEVVNMLLHDEYNQIADINSDGLINVLDVIVIVNIII